MNRKSLAITSVLFALTFAVPPPFNTFLGTTMFLGLKLYKTAIIFFAVTLLLFMGPLIAFFTTPRFEQIIETQDIVAHQIANATMADPTLFPYLIVGLITSILLEIISVGILVFPIWFIRKKVYPHVKQQLGHET